MYLLELSLPIYLFIYLDYFYHNMICTIHMQFTYIIGKYKVYLYERKILWSFLTPKFDKIVHFWYKHQTLHICYLVHIEKCSVPGHSEVGHLSRWRPNYKKTVSGRRNSQFTFHVYAYYIYTNGHYIFVALNVLFRCIRFTFVLLFD